ncbi:MAG: GNAT family N-acetyltransferase [Methanomicrobiales archaeon]|nr:GNAT family N-acetyltransferase [Methanomicrobiales archaeon]
MGIEILKDREQWDRFVDGSPYGSIFHQWDILKIVEKHTRFQFLPYGITKGEKLIALLPLFSRRVYGLRMVASPPPRTGIPHMGFVVSEAFDTQKQDRREQDLETIGTELAGELETLAPDHFFMSLPPNFLDVRIFRWLGFEVIPSYTYFLDLTPPPEKILASFKNKRRGAIKSALQSGLSLEIGSDPEDLYRLMKARYDELGQALGIPGIEYLQDLSRTLPDAIRICNVRDGDQVVASTMLTRYKDMKFWLGMPKPTGNANDFLIWQVILEAKSQGFSTLEVVGANTRHLSAFKSQFNPALVPGFNIRRRNRRAAVAEYLYRLTKHRKGSAHEV